MLSIPSLKKTPPYFNYIKASCQVWFVSYSWENILCLSHSRLVLPHLPFNLKLLIR